jgi:hypothetical protein
MADIIDRLLEERVQAAINGAPTKMSALEAIVYHLSQKWLSGNGRALRVLLEYKDYFQRRQPAEPAKVVLLKRDDTRAAPLVRTEQGDV